RIAARSAKLVKLIKVPDAYDKRSAKHPVITRRLIHKTIALLQRGDNVLFFPGGRQKLTPYEEINGKSAVQRILKLYPNVNIFLITMTGMWGIRFSRAVTKSQRSDLMAQSWVPFVWNIVKIILLNFFVFIPKRSVKIDFVPVGPDFPRLGTR